MKNERHTETKSRRCLSRRNVRGYIFETSAQDAGSLPHDGDIGRNHDRRHVTGAGMKNGSHLPPEVTAEKGDDHNLLFILKNVCTKGGER